MTETFFSSFITLPVFSPKDAFSYTSTMQQGVLLPQSDQIKTQNDSEHI